MGAHFQQGGPVLLQRGGAPAAKPGLLHEVCKWDGQCLFCTPALCQGCPQLRGDRLARAALQSTRGMCIFNRERVSSMGGDPRLLVGLRPCKTLSRDTACWQGLHGLLGRGPAAPELRQAQLREGGRVPREQVTYWMLALSRLCMGTGWGSGASSFVPGVVSRGSLSLWSGL